MDERTFSMLLAQAQVLQVLLNTLGVDREVFQANLNEGRNVFEDRPDAAEMYDAYLEFLAPYDL